MPRPDEGLIHAWLDGELDAAEAARVEKLVAEDAEWGAAAAEARGLVAASSRILGALDVVAGDVIPGGGRAAPAQDAPRIPRPQVVPLRRSVPNWLRVAAGAVLVAGVGYLANRDGRVESGVMRIAADSSSVAEVSVAKEAPADVPASPPAVAGASVREDARSDRASSSVRAAEPAATLPPTPSAAPAAELARVAEDRAVENRAVSADSLATARLAETEARERRTRSSNARLEQVVVTGVPSAPATVSAAPTRALAGTGAPVGARAGAQKTAARSDASAMAAPLASAAGLGAAAPSAPISILSGCWRVRTTGVSDTLLVTIPVLRQLGDTLVVRVTASGAEAKVQRVRPTALGPTALSGTATTASGTTVPFTADVMRCPRP
jgi:hypothetical protein